MPSKWIEHIKDFASRNNLSYGCALSDPRCKEEYHKNKPQKLTSKEKKEVAGMEAEESTGDINRKLYKKEENKKRTVALKSKLNKALVKKQLVETMGMAGEDVNVQPKKRIVKVKKITALPVPEPVTPSKRGRPVKYSTEEERKKAKSMKTVESNRRKRLEKKNQENI